MEKRTFTNYSYIIPKRKLITIVTTIIHIGLFARNIFDSTIDCNREEKVHNKRRFWEYLWDIYEASKVPLNDNVPDILTKINQWS